MERTNENSKVLREMVNQETSLLNSRLTLIVTINSILLVALGLCTKDNSKLTDIKIIPVICLVGILTSLTLFITIILADLAIRKLKRIWDNAIEGVEKNVFPEIIGLKIHGFFAYLLWGIIPASFIFIWLYILLQHKISCK
jgi:hypothetical protein